MQRILLLLCSIILTAPLALADDIWQMRLDDAAALGTTIETDVTEKVEGTGAVRITTKHPTTICIDEVQGLDVENARLIYKAKVKSRLKGVAYLEMWAHVGTGSYFSRGINDPVKGNSDWKLIQTPFIFQQGQKPHKVTLNLVINGTGTLWIDDVALSKVPLK